MNRVMLKTILVRLNGSPSSRAAGEMAIAWAKQHHAEIVGVGGVEPERQRPEGDLAEAHRRVEALLTEFEWSGLSAGLAASDVETEQLSARTGGVWETLLRHVMSIQSKLIVSGVFGESWTRSVRCGSVTKRLLHESCAPLLWYH